MFEREMSSAELARLSGISAQTIRRMLNGKSSPSVRTLSKLADALGYKFKIRLTMDLDEE
jgi:transcriptional regulator with XRE-family HTH domain